MNDDLQTYIDPELEARIVALMLGESSAFEAEELERLIAEKPELKAYWTSLEQLHGVVSDAFRKQDNEDWKISKDKRGKIQAKINKKKRHDMVLARRERISKVAQLKLVYACAACLVFTLSIVALKNSFKSVKNEAEVGIVTADSEAKERRLERFYYNANSRAFDAESRGEASKEAAIALTVPSESPPDEHTGLLAELDDAILPDSLMVNDGLASVEEGDPERAKGRSLQGSRQEISAVSQNSDEARETETVFELKRDQQESNSSFSDNQGGELVNKSEMREKSAKPSRVQETKPTSVSSENEAFATLTNGSSVIPAPKSTDLDPSADFENGESLGEGRGDKVSGKKIGSEDRSFDAGKVSQVDFANSKTKYDPPELPNQVVGGIGGQKGGFGGGGNGGDGFPVTRAPAAPAVALEERVVSDRKRVSKGVAVPSETLSASGRRGFGKSAASSSRKFPASDRDTGLEAQPSIEADAKQSSNLKIVDAISDSEKMSNTPDQDLDGGLVKPLDQEVMREIKEENLGNRLRAEATADKIISGHNDQKLESETLLNRIEDVGQVDGAFELSQTYRKSGQYGKARAELLKTVDEEWGLTIEASIEEDPFGEARGESNLELVSGGYLGLRKNREAVPDRFAFLDQDGELGNFFDVTGLVEDVDPFSEEEDEEEGSPPFLIDGIGGDFEFVDPPVNITAVPLYGALESTDVEASDILTRRWVLSPEVAAEVRGATANGKSLAAVLKENGVAFMQGASVKLLETDNTLIVRNSPTSLNLVNEIVAAAQAFVKKKSRYLEKQWLLGESDTESEADPKQEVVQQDFKPDPPKKNKTIASFEISTKDKTDSTFSLNVSDVSFKLVKAALSQGNWPDSSKIRPEEFVNALDYDDTKPNQAEKVSCEIEQCVHPFIQQRNLMRVSMNTASLGRNATTPLRLTILLDQSGSMERADRAKCVQRAFALLTSQLTMDDEITLVGFARTSRLLAERVNGDEAKKLVSIVANPLSEGGTNLEEALSTGLQLAKQQFLQGAQNRVILLTDGAANLGDAKPANLSRQVDSMRRSDIAFDACGVGADGLNDDILSKLAKKGDGRYYFLDRPEDADNGFARQIAGALRPVAKNVKVQVVFNPTRVSTFKLYGFEKHKLKKQDFRNDSVDAAEMAAEESGVALYQFEPIPDGLGDIGTVSVRFLDTSSNQMVERVWMIPYEEESLFFSEADPKIRLASVAGLFSEKIKGSPIGDRVELKRLRQEMQLLKPNFGNQARFNELQSMLLQAGD